MSQLRSEGEHLHAEIILRRQCGLITRDKDVNYEYIVIVLLQYKKCDKSSTGHSETFQVVSGGRSNVWYVS